MVVRQHLFKFFALLGCALAFGRGVAAAAQEHCAGLEPGPTRTVVRVIDGETLALDDRSELRLIGALAPRAMDVGAKPGEWPAEERTKEALSQLVAGTSVDLAFQGERQDRYGRIQAQVFVSRFGQRHWVQGHLLEQGLARAYAIAGSRACVSELVAAERVARAARRGLWAEAAYQVRSASEVEELKAYRSTFQLIEGRIARASASRGTIYLNFDRNWRQGFSAFVRSGESGVIGMSEHNLRALEGRYVRLRGWIEGQAAPRLDLSTSGVLEVLDGVPAPYER